ncbi:MAG: RIP metalloprotease RseP, partial [Halobacteriovoraceae bacterium]|nr:RIP metalloprotease RseP [Halobacteriovoraceae bacterium]
FPEMKLGIIPQNSVFYQKGMRSGDIIHKIGDKKIFNHSDIAFQDEFIEKIIVKRRNQEQEINLSMTSESFLQNFVKYPPLLRKPILVNDKGERFVVSSSRNVDLEFSLDEMIDSTKINRLFIFKVKGDGKQPVKRENIDQNPYKELKIPSGLKLDSFLGKHRLRSQDLMIKNIQMDSPADKAGMKNGDVITVLSGKPIYSFNQLRTYLQEIKSEKVKLEVWRNGKIMNFTVKPKVITRDDNKEVKIIGIYGQGSFLAVKTVQAESKGFFSALGLAFSRTWDSIVKTVSVLKKLVFREVSFKTIGGPLAIGKFAADSFNTGLSYFFQLMALISINLGVINLLPIPVLDGGHIMFIFLEILNRRPISKRKMEIAQQLGLSILLILMVGALFNDFSRLF